MGGQTDRQTNRQADTQRYLAPKSHSWVGILGATQVAEPLGGVAWRKEFGSLERYYCTDIGTKALDPALPPSLPPSPEVSRSQGPVPTAIAHCPRQLDQPETETSKTMTQSVSFFLYN